MSAWIVAGGNASPVLELGERILDACAVADRGSCSRRGTARLADEGIKGGYLFVASASRNQALS